MDLLLRGKGLSSGRRTGIISWGIIFLSVCFGPLAESAAGGNAGFPAIARVRIKVYEIPGHQEISREWKENGVPMIWRKGADVSLSVTDSGLIIQSKVRSPEVADDMKALRLRFPQTNLGEQLKISCLYEEIVDLKGKADFDEIERQATYERGKNISFSIKIGKTADPAVFQARIRLWIKLNETRKQVIDGSFSCDISKQLHVGFPSHLGNGFRGNVYFVSLLLE